MSQADQQEADTMAGDGHIRAQMATVEGPAQVVARALLKVLTRVEAIESGKAGPVRGADARNFDARLTTLKARMARLEDWPAAGAKPMLSRIAALEQSGPHPEDEGRLRALEDAADQSQDTVDLERVVSRLDRDLDGVNTERVALLEDRTRDHRVALEQEQRQVRGELLRIGKVTANAKKYAKDARSQVGQVIPRLAAAEDSVANVATKLGVLQEQEPDKVNADLLNHLERLDRQVGILGERTEQPHPTLADYQADMGGVFNRLGALEEQGEHERECRVMARTRAEEAHARAFGLAESMDHAQHARDALDLEVANSLTELEQRTETLREHAQRVEGEALRAKLLATRAWNCTVEVDKRTADAPIPYTLPDQPCPDCGEPEPGGCNPTDCDMHPDFTAEQAARVIAIRVTAHAAAAKLRSAADELERLS